MYCWINQIFVNVNYDNLNKMMLVGIVEVYMMDWKT